jgi:hypothetical protein
VNEPKSVLVGLGLYSLIVALGALGGNTLILFPTFSALGL